MKINRSIIAFQIYIIGTLASAIFILSVLMIMLFPNIAKAQSASPSSTPTPTRPASIVVATPGSDVGRAYSPNIRPAAIPAGSSEYAIMAYTATQNALTINELMEANATQSAILGTRRAVLEGDFATQADNLFTTATAGYTTLNTMLQQANTLATQQSAISATQSANVLATATAGYTTLNTMLQQANAVSTQQSAISATQSANVLATATAGYTTLNTMLQQANAVSTQQADTSATQSANVLATATAGYSTQEAITTQQAIDLEILTIERDTLLSDLQLSEVGMAQMQVSATELAQIQATQVTQLEETLTSTNLQLEALTEEVERLNATVHIFTNPIVLDVSAQSNGLTFQLFEGIYEKVNISTTITWGTGASDDYCGLVVLAQDPSNYYTVELDRTGTVRVYGYVNATWEAVSLSQSKNMNLLENGSNWLDVTLLENQIQVSVNDEAIISGQGLLYTAGRLGFMAGRFNNTTNTSSCRFSDTYISVP